jgi:hypothetical protein
MFLTPLETDNKQILRRCAPQNDIATSPQGDGQQAYNPNFRRSTRRSRRIWICRKWDQQTPNDGEASIPSECEGLKKDFSLRSK